MTIGELLKEYRISQAKNQKILHIMESLLVNHTILK